MKNAVGVDYFYDGDGKRVKKDQSSGSTYDKLYWYGLSADPLLETDLSGTVTDEYIFFGGKRTARRKPDGTIHYYFADHLGSSRVVTSTAGGILEDSDYYPFGGERVVTDTTNNNYKFTGKERDSESGLDNFGFRYESSLLGRFISPDPVMASGRVLSPQTWNRYTYALNNPLRFLDQFGLFASPAYQCTDTPTACLNDEQRRILEESTVSVNGKLLSGEALYNALNEQQQNAFVNVTDRLASITFEDGTNALSQVSSLSGIAADRIFANVADGLADRLKSDNRFEEAPAGLHKGFDDISFKSKDKRGNIQISFNKTRTGVDMDHDLYAPGAEHVFLEVLKNKITGSKTDQNEVRKLLMARPEVAITPSPDPKFNRAERR